MSALIHGDALTTLRTLPSESVQCCVTSPPYFGLRDYGVDGQLGLEPTPGEYVAQMVEVFREVRRVLCNDGTLWLNIGDSYSSRGAGADGKELSYMGKQASARTSRKPPDGLKRKDLIGIPWRVAFALQADGWYLRQDIIWNKPNPMPESVRDRCTKAHEYVFLLSKSAKYFFDSEAMKEPAVTGWNGSEFAVGKTGEHQLGRSQKDRKPRPSGHKSHKYVTAYEQGETQEHRTKAGLLKQAGVIYETRNRRSVWTIPSTPSKVSHFAMMPLPLAKLCVAAGSREGDTVLDPFGGAGTTAAAAVELGRKWVLIELNAAYCDAIRDRVRQKVLF